MSEEPTKKYKASEMFKITSKDGVVSYGKPRHNPPQGWRDYDIVPTEEVDTEA